MSSSVDDRIVAMKFENRQFEMGIGSTITSLGRLKSAMDLTAAGSTATRGLGMVQSVLSRFGVKNPFASSQKGLQELQATTGRFSMSTMEGGITSVSKSFVAMSTIAITALSQITTSALRAGGDLAKAFTIEPISTGLAEYEMTLNSTQTMMSATGETVESVTKTLEELNEYSDRTIYSFADMTKNITAFTNAGMKSKPAARVMMGIANASASAGISAEAAGRAMYGFGQSMSMGFVGLQDWNQVDNAGLATKEFKNELIESAIAVGTLKRGMDGTVRTTKGTEVNFRNLRSTLQEQWLTSKALTDTLDRYSDTSTEVGKKAQENATRVKTLSQAMDVLKEAAQSGWSQTWKVLFGNLEEASKLWTGFNDTIGGMIGASAKSRNALLKDWKELGGRQILIDGISNGFENLLAILKPIGQAFRDVFPKKTAEDLLSMSESFKALMDQMKPSEETVTNVRRIFAGLFSVLDIAGQIFGGVVDGFQALFGALGGGEGNFLSFAAGVGDIVVNFSNMLRESGLITAFFEGLGNVLAVPLKLIVAVAGGIASLFTGFDENSGKKIVGAFDSLKGAGEGLETMAQRIREIFSGIGDVLSKIGDVIGPALSGIGDAIANAFSGASFDKALDVINTGLLGAIVLMLKNFTSGGLLSVDLGGGLFDSVKETLGSVTEAMENMQTNIKADILLKIAGALALLTASIVVLSLIDSKKLAKAMTGMAVGFAGLQVAMTALAGAVGYIGLAKLPVVAASLVILGGAMLIFSTALLILSRIDTKDMIKGLLGMTIMMRMLTKAVVPLSKNSAGMITAGIGLTAVAVALNIMAMALKSFAEMSWEEMGKGLAGAAGSLIVLAGAMRLMPKDIAMQAVAIGILSVSLNIMAKAVKAFGEMDMQSLGQGLLGVFASLTLIAGAMRLMPKNMLIQAAALVVVSSALLIMQSAVEKFGGMSMEAIATGLIALGGSLLVLAGGLYLMGGSLAGAAALVIATGALAVLTPILVTLGSLSIETIAKALGTLAATFVIFGVASHFLAPAVPILIGLGAAIVLIGGGFALAGAGALAFATAFGIFVAAGAAGIAVLSGLLDVIIKAIPRVVKALGQGIVEMLKTISKAAPLMIKTFSNIFAAFLDSIIKNVPKIGKAFTTLIMTGLNVIVKLAPAVANAGLALLVGLLQAINNNIGRIVPLAVSIVTKFINGLANNIGRLIQAGVNFILKFLEGLTRAINNNSAKMGEAGADLAIAMVNGMVNGLSAGASRIKDAAMDAARAAYEEVKDFFKIFSPSRRMKELGQYVSEGFAVGITEGEGAAVEAMDHMSELINASAQGATAEVERLQAKLKSLKKQKGDQSKEIKETEKLLKAARQERKLSEEAHQSWMKGSKAERAAMKEQGKLYDAKLAQIKEEQEELEKLIDLRDREAESITNQYSAVPDITGSEEDPVTPEEYAAGLLQKAAAVEQFQRDLSTLRSMGMDDDTYRMLLEEGLDAQPFVTQMLSGGADMVQAIAYNTGVLNAAAANLGTTAAGQMHDAGIRAQEGLIAGLEGEEGLAGIEKVMKKLAKKMIKALKKALKINSPSREFAEIGRFSNEGLANGLDAYSDLTSKAAADVGNKALDTLKVSMSKVGETIDGDVNFNPVVTPVLDLTNLQKEATKIGGMLDTGIITPSMSLDQARAIAEAAEAAKDASEAAEAKTVNLKLEQTNVSPKPLDPVDSFRNTKSGLSLMKEALSSGTD